MAVRDDIFFGLIGVVLLGLGVLGMGKAVEGGFSAWVGGIPQGAIVSSLFSPDEGFNRTIASWLIALGVGFYLYWSLINTTWVDPGVYSVMISFVMVGVGLNWVQDAKLDN